VLNRSNYKERNETDPYLQTSDYVLQHVTVEDYLTDDEDFSNSSSQAKFKVLLRDLAIKRDLQQAKAGFLAMTDSADSHQYSFHMIDGYGARKTQAMGIYSVQITHDFSIKAEKAKDDIGGFTVSLADKLNAISSKLKAIIKHYPKFEGWVENESGERNYIFHTEEIVMPDLEAFKYEVQQLERALPADIQNPKVAAEIVGNIIGDPDANAEASKVNELLSLIEAEKLSLTKARLKQLINNVFTYQSSAAKYLKKRLMDDHEISFGISRGKDAGNLHEYRAGLRYWEENGIGYYCSGEWDLSGLKASKARADHIRVVIPEEGSSLFFKELLPGMNEEIVHLAQRSVLPAGFKYVREFTNSLRVFQENERDSYQ
jgi:hypothetical protein